MEELKRFTDDLIPDISIFAVTDNEIYFKISESFNIEEYENIMKYNMKDNKFSKVTNDGYISYPMGIF